VQLLLDTHVFLWLLAEPEQIGENLATLEDPAHDLFLSAASSWEIAIKVQLGRLTLPVEPRRYVPDRMRAIGVRALPIEHMHALAVSELPPLHRDPFDRLLVTQARLLELRIVTSDAQIMRYEVDTLRVS
jgi:PIN domain nuclease of toxin-antitoxin system